MLCTASLRTISQVVFTFACIIWSLLIAGAALAVPQIQAREAVYIPFVNFPTHNRLTFTQSNLVASIIGAAGANPQSLNLRNSRPTTTSPTWSRDGSHIALFQGDDQNSPTSTPPYVLVTVSAATSQVITRTTLTDTQPLSNPIWSPTTNDIAYQTNTGLYLLPENTDIPQRISTVTDTLPNDPVWSPDGNWLSLRRCVVQMNTQYVTFCFSNDSATSIRLEWAPNSKQLAIDVIEGRQRTLLVADVNDLSHPRTLLRSTPAEFSWVWSPDSRTITVAAQGNNQPMGLFLVPINGTTWQKVSLTKEIEQVLSWSPDGSYILYTHSSDVPVVETLLVIARPDGSIRSTIPFPSNLSDIAWSRDSSLLATTSTLR